ncbi:PREDICTED: mitochondrial calcium uniporter regulator 1 [Calidris pugnax]|uniref:mitochondrial calcium uniporter regulator 1 n=1 Tax=Calidris pugnax TaxID=198806 RepID=UPI00071CDD91|nr:PREDICTED: mitochondrial calcium uniporter regulator 1 [Calidris pugnax]
MGYIRMRSAWISEEMFRRTTQVAPKTVGSFYIPFVRATKLPLNFLHLISVSPVKDAQWRNRLPLLCFCNGFSIYCNTGISPWCPVSKTDGSEATAAYGRHLQSAVNLPAAQYVAVFNMEKGRSTGGREGTGKGGSLRFQRAGPGLAPASAAARPRSSSRRGVRLSHKINRRRSRRVLPRAGGGSETLPVAEVRRLLSDAIPVAAAAEVSLLSPRRIASPHPSSGPGAGWGRRVGQSGRERRRRRCGERDISVCVSSPLQSKGNISLWGTRKVFFDTHALVCLLEENGFTTQQSEVIVSALVKIMNTNLDMIYKDMVTKVQQEIALQQVMSHIGGVKKDMIILEKSEFSALRSENEKIKLELQQIKKQVADEITKVRADNKLNLNLEKSRVKELYSLNERKLLEMRTEIVELHAQQDRALTQTDRKIDTEVADLKTMLETHKLDNIKYLAGSVFTCLTVALGFYRLWR